YTYRGEARWRDYFRGTAAHNTIRIASQDQSQRLGPFQWGRQARARLIGLDAAGEHPVGSEAAGEHDGYRHLGILHRRSVRWQEGSWRVEDHLSGKGTHTVELFWHLAPCRWRWSAVDTLEAEFPGCRLLIRITAAAALQLRVVEGVESAPQGWYSPRFGQKKANPVLCVNTNEPLPVHIMTEIRVAGADRAHPREIERS
ncbi:MAG TPA: heparinase II/III-family protein, partial [bacterium]|nr:heparinase II/III-family protein [bacterium]